MIRLSREQSRALEDWLLSKKSSISAERIDRVTLAAQAAKALGFDVNPGHVTRASLTVGIVMPRKSGPRATGKSGPSNLVMVARALADIIDKLGEKVPYDLAAYIASKEGK